LALIYRSVDVFFNILYLLLLIRVILSWVGRGIPYNSRWRGFITFVYSITEPILRPIRQVLPTSGMGIDFSPIVAFLLLSLVRNIILNILTSLIV